MVGLGPRSAIERAEIGNSRPTVVRACALLDQNSRELSVNMSYNKYPPAKPEGLRLLAPQRGLTAIAKSKPKTEQTTNGRLPELSNFGSPPAEPRVYHD